MIQIGNRLGVEEGLLSGFAWRGKRQIHASSLSGESASEGAPYGAVSAESTAEICCRVKRQTTRVRANAPETSTTKNLSSGRPRAQRCLFATSDSKQGRSVGVDETPRFTVAGKLIQLPTEKSLHPSARNAVEKGIPRRNVVVLSTAWSKGASVEAGRF